MKPETTRLDGLKAFRDHLLSLDSKSGDAEILTWGIDEIERRMRRQELEWCGHVPT